MRFLVIAALGLIAIQTVFFGVEVYCQNVAHNRFKGYYENVESRLGPRGCEFRVVGAWLKFEDVYR